MWWLHAMSQANLPLTSEQPIEFFCAICGQALTAESHFAGSVISCPTCHRSVPVPGRLAWSDPGASWYPAFSPEILSVEVTFVCPKCNNALIADARWSGEPFTCPLCETNWEVPDWTRARMRPPDPDAPAMVKPVELSAEEIEFLSSVEENSNPRE